LYYCLGGISSFVFAFAGIQRRIEKRRKERKKKCSGLGFHYLDSFL
jgi:hypothetical protein